MKTAIKEVKNFAEFVRRRRNELNLTQIELAKALGYKNGEAIGMIENQGRNMDQDKLPALAIALKCSLSDLAQMFFQEQAPMLAAALFQGTTVRKSNNFRLTEEEQLIMKLKHMEHNTRDVVIRMINTLYDQAKTTPIAA